MENSSHKNIKKPLPWVQILIVVVTLAAVVITMFLGDRVYKENRQMVLEQFNRQQLIMARLAAFGIESYFNEVGAVLMSTAKLPAVQSMTSGCLEHMQRMYTGFLPRTSIRRLDENGVLRFIYPSEGWRGKLVGRDYSGEAFFQRVRDTGRAIVSGVIINEQGAERIRVPVPVYLTETAKPGAGQFKGVLIVSFDIKTIAKKFICPIVSGKTGYAWLINQDGYFLAHHEAKFMGKDAFKVRAERNPDLSFEAVKSIQQKMLAGEEAIKHYVSGWHRERTERVEKLIAYAPININGLIWSVAVCAPVEEVDWIMRAEGRNALYAFGFVIFILTAGGGFLFATAHRWSQSLEREVGKRTKELRESEEFSTNLLSNSPHSVIVINPDTSIRYVNFSLEELTGFSSAELIGRKAPYPWWTEHTLQKTSSDLKEAMQKGARMIEEIFQRKDGEQFWVEITSVPVIINGELKYYLANWVDITKRKQAEEALRKSEEKYRTILENMEEGYFESDIAGNVTFCNDSVCETLGYSHGELMGMNNREYTTPEAAKTIYQVFGEIYRTGKPASIVDYEIIGKGGETRIVDLSVSLMRDSTGKPIGFRGLGRDITERKILEAETMRVGHLASIGELAAGVAHEINNPINGIINYAQILVDQSDEQDEVAGIAGRIIKEGDRIADIVKSLLTFACDWKEETGPALIPDILSDSLSLVETQILKDGIRLKVDVSPDLPEIKAHKQQIQQVFLNILSNARHALSQRFSGFHENKVLEIRGEVVEVEGRRHIRTTFYDRGTGIPADILDRICAPFFSTKPRGEGTGLGLSISHGIIEDHGGRLWFDSVEGEYTKVMVDLPV